MPQNHYTAVAQHSTTTAAVFQALAFVPVVTVCAIGAQKEIEPQHRNNLFMANATIKRSSSDLTPGIPSYQKQ